MILSMTDDIEMTLERMEALVKRMDKQIGEMGEATGMMLWDLHYAATEMSADDLFDVVCVWLETGFAKAVMGATESQYGFHTDFNRLFAWSKRKL